VGAHANTSSRSTKDERFLDQLSVLLAIQEGIFSVDLSWVISINQNDINSIIL
jgi:hypothetical protein